MKYKVGDIIGFNWGCGRHIGIIISEADDDGIYSVYLPYLCSVCKADYHIIWINENKKIASVIPRYFTNILNPVEYMKYKKYEEKYKKYLTNGKYSFTSRRE